MHDPHVPLSQRDNRLDTECTDDLRQTWTEPGSGRIRSTAYRMPLELISYQACRTRDDALRLERFLTTGKAKGYLKDGLARFLSH